MHNLFYGLLSVAVIFFLIKYFPKQVAITVAGAIGLVLLVVGGYAIIVLTIKPKWDEESRQWAENSLLETHRSMEKSNAEWAKISPQSLVSSMIPSADASTSLITMKQER